MTDQPSKPETELFEFHVGDRVHKHSGDYQAFGCVIARGWTRAGKARYLIEVEAYPGMLMVFSAKQLKAANVLAADGVSFADNIPAQSKLPELPDDDADFTPELARKIIAKYQTIIRNMTPSVSPHDRPGPGRCEVCDWPLAVSRDKGCVPGDCCYRPDDPAEQRRLRERREQIAARRLQEAPAPQDSFQCMARKQSLPEPADCNWPDCGCDPYATKVIAALQEQGVIPSVPPPHERQQAPGPHANAAWAASRWQSEVANRPLQNVHRRALDTTWRQVIRHFGGNDEALCGPTHDQLVAEPVLSQEVTEPKP